MMYIQGLAGWSQKMPSSDDPRVRRSFSTILNDVYLRKSHMAIVKVTTFVESSQKQARTSPPSRHAAVAPFQNGNETTAQTLRFHSRSQTLRETSFHFTGDSSSVSNVQYYKM